MRTPGLLLAVALLACSGGDNSTSGSGARERGDCLSAGDAVQEVTPSTYVLIVMAEQGEAVLPIMLGTGFAIDKRLIATNSHMTQGLIETVSSIPNQGVVAVQSGTGDVVDLNVAFTNPRWTGDPTMDPDVGLITTQQELPVLSRLASAEDASELAVSDRIVVVGFPGDVEDQFAPTIPGKTVPQATALQGDVTALRSFDASKTVTPENVDLIQHSAATSPGMSGSPILHCGEVVAVNNAGTVQVFLTQDADGNVRPDRVPAANNNFGIAVKHLHDLVAQFKDQALQGFDFNDPENRGRMPPPGPGAGPPTPPDDNGGGGGAEPSGNPGAGTTWIDLTTPSGERCGVVNGADFEGVILKSGEFAIVTGQDGLTNLVVDSDGFLVDHDHGTRVGAIGFFQDAEGASRVWAVDMQGAALALDPQKAGTSPSDYANVPCDACDLVDDPAPGACR